MLGLVDFDEGDVEVACMASASANYSAKAVPFGMETAVGQRLCYECGELLGYDEYDDHTAFHETESLVQQLVHSELHRFRRFREELSKKTEEERRGRGSRRKRRLEEPEMNTMSSTTSSKCRFPAFTLHREVQARCTMQEDEAGLLSGLASSDATLGSCFFENTSNWIIVPTNDSPSDDKCIAEKKRDYPYDSPATDANLVLVLEPGPQTTSNGWNGSVDDDDDEEIDVGTNPSPVEMAKDQRMIETNIGKQWSNVYVKVFHIDEQIRTIFKGVATGKMMRRNPSRGARPPSGSMSDKQRRRTSALPTC